MRPLAILKYRWFSCFPTALQCQNVHHLAGVTLTPEERLLEWIVGLDTNSKILIKHCERGFGTTNVSVS